LNLGNTQCSTQFAQAAHEYMIFCRRGVASISSSSHARRSHILPPGAKVSNLYLRYAGQFMSWKELGSLQ